MFLATVILLLSCIENTSSSSTVQICSVFSSIKHAHDGSVVRTDYKLVQFQLQQLYGEIVQLQSALNDDYNNVQEKSNMYHISEPIIRRFFSKTCATLFTFEQFSLIHSALQWNAATLRRFWRLFRSVMWSILVPFKFLFSFFPFFLDFFLIVVKFLIKQLFYSGLLDIKWL